ncbi:MAG: hypothetical protein LBB67_02845 [Oscillospiraceae bacterium]|jgi:cytoskeletal protein RodZ|nr:hypothetical protein [Oscillospiraceae bacterium]
MQRFGRCFAGICVVLLVFAATYAAYAVPDAATETTTVPSVSNQNVPAPADGTTIAAESAEATQTTETTAETTLPTMPDWATETDIFGETVYPPPPSATTTTTTTTTKSATTTTKTKPTTTTKKTVTRHPASFEYNPAHPDDVDGGYIPKGDMPTFYYTLTNEAGEAIDESAYFTQEETTDPYYAKENQSGMARWIIAAVAAVVFAAALALVILMTRTKNTREERGETAQEEKTPPVEETEPEAIAERKMFKNPFAYEPPPERAETNPEEETTDEKTNRSGDE